jgi:hypothetical protein
MYRWDTFIDLEVARVRHRSGTASSGRRARRGGGRNGTTMRDAQRARVLPVRVGDIASAGWNGFRSQKREGLQKACATRRKTEVAGRVVRVGSVRGIEWRLDCGRVQCCAMRPARHERWSGVGFLVLLAMAICLPKAAELSSAPTVMARSPTLQHSRLPLKVCSGARRGAKCSSGPGQLAEDGFAALTDMAASAQEDAMSVLLDTRGELRPDAYAVASAASCGQLRQGGNDLGIDASGRRSLSEDAVLDYLRSFPGTDSRSQKSVPLYIPYIKPLWSFGF